MLPSLCVCACFCFPFFFYILWHPETILPLPSPRTQPYNSLTISFKNANLLTQVRKAPSCLPWESGGAQLNVFFTCKNLLFSSFLFCLFISEIILLKNMGGKKQSIDVARCLNNQWNVYAFTESLVWAVPCKSLGIFFLCSSVLKMCGTYRDKFAVLYLVYFCFKASFIPVQIHLFIINLYTVGL